MEVLGRVHTDTSSSLSAWVNKGCTILSSVRPRSHWYEYESRVRVSVYGSYKLHPYEWSIHGHYTSPNTSTRVYQQSPV